MAITKGMTAAAFWFAVLVVFAAVILLVERSVMQSGIEVALDEPGKLTGTQSAAMGQISNLGKLMINWSVAILGGIAVSIRQVKDWTGWARGISFVALGLSFMSAILSIWCGMLVLDTLIQSLTYDENPLENSRMRGFRVWQYYFFVASLLLFVSSWLNIGLFLSDENPDPDA